MTSFFFGMLLDQIAQHAAVTGHRVQRGAQVVRGGGGEFFQIAIGEGQLLIHRLQLARPFLHAPLERRGVALDVFPEQRLLKRDRELIGDAMRRLDVFLAETTGRESVSSSMPSRCCSPRNGSPT